MTRAAGPGVALSATTIVDRALELAEREGAAALSMRRLGRELGVDATAFYRHFRDKDELVLALADRTIESVLDRLRDITPDTGWRSALRRIADAMWQQAQEHPVVFALTFARSTGGPAERQVVEIILRTLQPLGLGAAKTVLLYRLFMDTLLALAGMGCTARTLPPEIAEKDVTAWSRVYAALPHKDFPATHKHAPALIGVTDHEIFMASVDSLITYIESQLA
ncbi:helix-turn-helix domain-containing protein [Actinocrispum sp. NPDC049592]|uniref:TetR/AcrR family transcriptional regulator n=1 Tax=Actinocrispum sp. NPDC049592 TaxID=3154835 RepID=UPI003415A25D